MAYILTLMEFLVHSSVTLFRYFTFSSIPSFSVFQCGSGFHLIPILFMLDDVVYSLVSWLLVSRKKWDMLFVNAHNYSLLNTCSSSSGRGMFM